MRNLRGSRAILVPVLFVATLLGSYWVADAGSSGGSSGGSGTIGGSTGATDDVALCADGTGGATVGACVNMVLGGNVTGPTAGFSLFGGTSTTADLIFQTTTGNAVVGSNMLFKTGNNGSITAIDISMTNAGTVSIQAPYFDHTPSGVLGWYSDGGAINMYRTGATINFGSSDPVAFWRPSKGTMSLQNGGGNESVSKSFWADAGKVCLAADATNATATMANLTGLTATLYATREYSFDAVFHFSDSVAAEGAAFDFAGGTGTATNFVANCQMFDAGLLLSAESTAIATDFAAATTTGASVLKCSGSFEVSAEGTFIPRAAQNSHTSGTLTVKRGSCLNIRDSRFN